ncbi:MAG: hypothetical protein ACK56C_05065 [Alphaproteobacteria bacterium]
MTLRSRIQRLEAKGGGPCRVFAVRRYSDETDDEALAAEHPGVTPRPNDLVVFTIQFSGSREEAAR